MSAVTKLDEPRNNVTHADADSIMAVISRAASDPGIDVEKLERLMGLYERVNSNNAKAAYAAAFARMQPELPVIGQKGKNTNTNQKYAKWEDIAEQIAPVLSRHGFSISFRVGNASGSVSVTGVLMHEQGHSEETTLPLPVDTGAGRNAVQAVGSSVSYGKRYTAGLLLNFVSRDQPDDDGRAAGLGETISENDLADLRDLIEEVNADIPALCTYLKIASLSEIPAKEFENVKRIVNRKRGK
jgi:hypothetical protein